MDGGWLRDGAIVVIEEAAEEGVALPSGLTQLDRRAYGETQIVFARVAPPVNG